MYWCCGRALALSAAPVARKCGRFSGRTHLSTKSRAWNIPPRLSLDSQPRVCMFSKYSYYVVQVPTRWITRRFERRQGT